MHRFAVVRSARFSNSSKRVLSSSLFRESNGVALERQQQPSLLTCNTKRFFSDQDASSEGWKEEIKSLIRTNRSPRDAQAVLDQARRSGTMEISDEGNLEVMRELFDVWIRHQSDLLSSYDAENPDREQLKRICEAAEQAHQLLEHMLPSFSSRPSLSPPLHGAKNEELSTRRHHFQEGIDATARCNALLAAWATASRAGHRVRTRVTRSIPQKAQFLLQKMEASHRKQDPTDIIVKPTVESYNLVMEAWAYSHEHLRGSMAERVFQRLADSEIQPNEESFRRIIWAWALSRERRAAFTATGHLRKMLRLLERGNKEMEPALADYRVVFRAWVSAEDDNAPLKALSVFKIMDYALEKRKTEVVPDFDCFRYLLITAAKRPLLPDLGFLVDTLLSKMSERFMVPDAACYGAAIRTWKNEAFNPDLVENRDRSVSRVLELLSEMQVAHNQSTSVSVKPTTSIVNDVLEVLSVSSSPKRWEQADQLLRDMEDALEKGSDDAIPDTESYRRVLDVWKTSSLEEKVAKAKDVLLRMLEKLSYFTEDQGVVGVFNSFISVCGSAEVSTEEEGMEVLKEALSAIETIRELDGLESDAETYANLLAAAKRLLAAGKERQRFVEKVFRLCCSAGMVDGNVLRKLRTVATPDQYLKLVTSVSEDIEGTKMVPEAWTINALGGRVVTADGRRATPLSIDGDLVVTMAMNEFRMRKIRDKRNRKWLRGGRLPVPGKEGKALHSI